MRIGRASGRDGRQSRLRLLLPPFLIVLAAGSGALWIGFDDKIVGDVARDADLCPVDADQAVGDVVFLVDLTKPVAGLPADMPARAFRDLTMELARDTEIRVYLVAGSADAPLALLERMCKPYDTEDLQVAEAKDHGGNVRDCDDLPAQMARTPRRLAGRFCDLRNALERRLDALVAKASQETWSVTDAYLVEAIDQIRVAFQERAGPHRLYVVSDMMLHAEGYSHLELDWSLWDYGDFARQPGDRNRLLGLRRNHPAYDVDIHYLVRRGMTAETEAADRHRRFWRAYFRGANVAFHDQPAIPGYESTPIMDPAAEPGMLGSEGEAGGEAASSMPDNRQPELTVRREREDDAVGGPAQETRPAAGGQPAVPGQRPADDDAVPAAPQEPALAAAGPQTPVDRERPLPPPGVDAESSDPGAPPPAVVAEQPPDPPGDAPAKSVAAVVPQSAGVDDSAPPRLQIATRPGSLADASTALAGNEAPPPALPSTVFVAEPDAAQGVEPPLALAGRTDEAGLPECPLERLEDSGDWRPEYPRQGGTNYGDAAITLSYVVDDDGNTVDGEVRVLREESRADRLRYFNRFARKAVASVRGWSFAPVDPAAEGCVRPASYKTTLHFRYD